jgi:single-stranded-DNA-specific exonuclease
MVEASGALENDLGIVLHHDDWHPGVIGIVASRLVEKYYRPAIMLTTIDGVAKGSARSISGFNIYQALESCDDILLQFGGHEAAAGLALEISKIDEFRTRINAILKSELNEDEVMPEINIDYKISLSEITPKFVRILDQFAPFGPGNMRPVFMAEDVEMVYHPRLVGANHLVTCFRMNDNDKIFDAIGFNLGGYVDRIEKNKNLFDIVFTIEKTVRDAKAYPQIRLKDLRIKPKE